MERERRAEIISSFIRDRQLAHRVLFAHRHNSPTPAFHGEIIADWHGTIKNLCDIAFRGSAKSTIGEEAVVLRACLREFQYCLLLGSSLDRACERLHAIRREFERNKKLKDIFGSLVGRPWGDEMIETTTGITIQAMGRGQAIRGTKQEIRRPDLVFADDIEDMESVRTPESREKVQKWFLGEVMPACDPMARIRIAANALDPECLAVRLKNRDSGFTVRTYPWQYRDRMGNWQPTWPGRFDNDDIEETRKRLYALGRGREYQMEYMCEASPPEDKPFRENMFLIAGKGSIEPVTRTWQSTFGMFDPARTVNRESATTGFAAWSWVGPRCIVWESWAKKLMPNEIVDAMFAFDEEFQPTWIGVEEDGLNEFLLQPIRAEQIRRGIVLPLKAVRAPKGKFSFIRGLQPWFNSREMIFAKPLPHLTQQLLGFPTGTIDALNSLAYAPLLRAGAPIYDSFGARNIGNGMRPGGGRPVFLAMNASRTYTTGILLQWIDGWLRVYADWVREGEPSECAPNIISEAQLTTGFPVRPVVGPQHFDTWTNVGLTQAIKKIPKEVSSSAKAEMGRPEIQEMLKREIRGYPAVIVNDSARWTLNALAGGYARAISKQGILSNEAEQNHYKLLMEGLESVAGLLARTGGGDDDDDKVYAVTPGGRKYQTALPQRG